jgi:NAD(P)-dependent dehydrogenase (short-subunit alcohol dehydrogenase family)
VTYKNKTAVITAAGHGIGREIAMEFARRGTRVVVSDRELAGAKSVAEEIMAAGGSATPVRCDVTSDSDFGRLQAALNGGPVDFLINHAGAAAAGPADAIPLDDWRWVFDVNVLGIVRALKLFLPDMLKRKSGVIINTSSSLGLMPEVPFALPYITTKAGIIGMSEALSLYCQPFDVRVITLVPDITETGFHFAGRMTGLDPAMAASALPLSLQQPPKAVSDALFAAIDEGRFLATNMPEAAALLRAKADELYAPRLRAYPQLASALEAMAEAMQ